MTQINCTIPIRVEVRGRLSETQLDELASTLIASVQSRIARAEEMVREGRVDGDFRLDAIPREILDEARLSEGTYTVPSYDNGGERVRVPVRSGGMTRDSITDVTCNYAFYFSGDAYERVAEDYLKRWYPGYVHFDARSFEQMFDILARDIQRQARRGTRVHIGEIIIVTHASAVGGLIIPLTRDQRGLPRSRRRYFSPWDLRALQQDFRSGLYQRFRRARRTVVRALSSQTRIIVRGCRFGLSSDGLDALRIFLGGHPTVFAPRGYQGFEPLPIGRGHSILRNPVEAFDFLVDQGYIPEDLRDLSDQEKKRRFLLNELHLRDVVSTEFFLMTKEDYESYERLRARRRDFSAEAEPLKRRPFESGEELVGANVPSGGEFWGLSSAPYIPDPELDALTLRQLEARARRLSDPYQPQNAAMLLRLRAAWDRRAGRVVVSGSDNPDDQLPGGRDDPLYGLLPPPGTFIIDSLILHQDAAVYPDPSAPYYDVFEEETLPYHLPSEAVQRQARVAEGADVLNEVAREGLASLRSGESMFGRRGHVSPLPDGLRLWNFGVGSADLRPQFRDSLTQLAQRAASDPLLYVLVDGHTSTTGSQSGNQVLGQRRAESVRQFLMQAGVPAARIVALSQGQMQPLEVDQRGGNVLLEQAAHNRRVEVRLVQAVDINRIAGQVIQGADAPGRAVGWQGRPTEPGTDWISPALTIGEIVSNVAAEIASYIAGAFLLELSFTFAGMALSIAGYLYTLHQAYEAQESAARRRGLELGVRVLVFWVTSREPVRLPITARQLEDRIVPHWDLGREWESQILYSPPFPSAVIRALRASLGVVASAINAAIRHVEAVFRRRLHEAGLNDAQVEAAVERYGDRLRRKVIERFIQQALDMMSNRRQ